MLRIQLAAGINQVSIQVLLAFPEPGVYLLQELRGAGGVLVNTEVQCGIGCEGIGGIQHHSGVLPEGLHHLPMVA